MQGTSILEFSIKKLQFPLPNLKTSIQNVHADVHSPDECQPLRLLFSDGFFVICGVPRVLLSELLPSTDGKTHGKSNLAGTFVLGFCLRCFKKLLVSGRVDLLFFPGGWIGVTQQHVFAAPALATGTPSQVLTDILNSDSGPGLDFGWKFGVDLFCFCWKIYVKR